MSPEERLEALGYHLHEPPTSNDKPYDPLTQIGRIIYGSGNTSMDRHRNHVYAGKVGGNVGTDEAQEYARIATVNALAALRAHVGELERIHRFLRLTGYVNSAPDFIEQAIVINAASKLLLDVFGARGRHARSAIGVAQLPGGAAVEVEVIVELENDA
jgi:enamine deaminase RidA (YjgF/YER057c/UK114 family)